MAFDEGLRKKEVLTTGEVAKICNVSPRTVTKWVDTGQLRGYRIPGTKYRRIPRQQLLRFMKVHAIPTDELWSEHRILICDSDSKSNPAYQALTQEGYELSHTANPLEAGIILERWRPTIFIMNLELPHISSEDVLSLCKNKVMEGVKLIAISTVSKAREEGRKLIEEGFSDVLGPHLSGQGLLHIVAAVLRDV